MLTQYEHNKNSENESLAFSKHAVTLWKYVPILESDFKRQALSELQAIVDVCHRRMRMHQLI
jgi:hypothetical protein